ncbi:MAG: glycosyltransferase family 39 protein, partial [Elusimicrobia bacterium]|nr:glycosyltransferase family 39 protein [Elusimicrobiota bacterium]
MKKLNKSTLLFIIISLFYAVTNYIYWLLNTPVLPYNIDALHFMDVFRQSVLYYNAPLIPTIIKSLFYWLNPKCFDLIIIFVNYIFFLAGLYSIYQLGKLFSSIKAGQLSMILFSLTPAVYSLSRFYGRQDYHVMIMMIISIYCLIKTDFFTNRKWVLLYSISTALGLLCKDSFIAYFIITYIYIVFKSLKNNPSKSFVNIILSFILIILFSSIHYLRPIIIFKILFEPISETETLNMLQNIYKLTFGLSQELLTLPLFILFIISFIWYLVKYNNIYKY